MCQSVALSISVTPIFVDGVWISRAPAGGRRPTPRQDMTLDDTQNRTHFKIRHSKHGPLATEPTKKLASSGQMKQSYVHSKQKDFGITCNITVWQLMWDIIAEISQRLCKDLNLIWIESRRLCMD